MVLAKVITQETIAVDLGSDDKWAAIARLVDLLASSRAGMDAPAVLSSVLERERQGSTGLENGIAIPHARSDGAAGVVSALGISRDGMDFQSADGKPCHLVFLVVAPPDQSARYLQVLSAVAAIGENPDRIARLRHASSPAEALAILGETGLESI